MKFNIKKTRYFYCFETYLNIKLYNRGIHHVHRFFFTSWNIICYASHQEIKLH